MKLKLTLGLLTNTTLDYATYFKINPLVSTNLLELKCNILVEWVITSYGCI